MAGLVDCVSPLLKHSVRLRPKLMNSSEDRERRPDHFGDSVESLSETVPPGILRRFRLALNSQKESVEAFLDGSGPGDPNKVKRLQQTMEVMQQETLGGTSETGHADVCHQRSDGLD